MCTDKLRPAGVDDGGVVWAVEANDHIVPRRRRDVAEGPGQHCRADLGAAAAAAHGDGREFLHGGLIGERRGRAARGFGHGGELVEPPHEAAVDEILPAPDPVAFDHEAVARADGVPLAGRDQVERLALRSEGPQRLSGQGAPDVVGQHRPGAYGIDAGLRQIARAEGGDIARGEHVVAALSAQAGIHPDEAARIEREAGLGEPRSGGGARGPEDLVGGKSAVTLAMQDAGLDPCDTRAGYDRDAALGEDALKAPPKCFRKIWQDLVRAGHEGEGETAGIMARLRHLAA